MDVVTFAAEVQNLKTTAHVSQALSRLTAPVGFPTHVISPVPTEEMPVQNGGFLVQNWPELWHETYLAENFARFDPIPRAATLISTPMTISEIREGKAGFVPAPEAEQIWATARKMNRLCGLLVPVFGPQGYRAIVCFAGPGPDPDAAARAALHLAAIYAHDRVRALSAADNLARLSLTGREVEILKAISVGATDGSVANRLGISVRTVRFHLSNARQKLQAKNREQAIAIAIGQGLI